VDCYLDIELRADPEFPPSLLMSALFGKFHRRLVEYGAGRIGVSFPDVGTGIALGERLRLHGSQADLQMLMNDNWLMGMRDHTVLGSISPVPVDARQRLVRRVQAKSSPERLRRRLIVRKGISEHDALLAIPDHAAEKLSLPYVVLKSRSTGQQFRLFVEHCPPQDKKVVGLFNTYGLSPSATVPWF